IARKEVMWRNEDFVSVLSRRLEDTLHILDGLVLRDALTDEPPGEPLLTQHLILRVDKYYRGVTLINVHGYLLFCTVERVTTYPMLHALRNAFATRGAKDRGRSIPDAHRDGDPAANNTCALIP